MQKEERGRWRPAFFHDYPELGALFLLKCLGSNSYIGRGYYWKGSDPSRGHCAEFCGSSLLRLFLLQSLSRTVRMQLRWNCIRQYLELTRINLSTSSDQQWRNNLWPENRQRQGWWPRNRGRTQLDCVAVSWLDACDDGDNVYKRITSEHC